MRSVLMVGLVLMSGIALANPVAELNLERPDFAKQKQTIEKAIVSGKDFVEMTAEDRSAVTTGLSLIASELQSAGSLDGLDAAKRARLMAEQSDINQRLQKAMADSRWVCTHEQVLGSNMKKRKCATVAARRRSAGEAQLTDQSLRQ